MKTNSTKEIAYIGALAALSAFVQLIHIGYLSPQWGMWIDIVAVSWFLGLFLLGLRATIFISLISALVITLFTPDAWLGAFMKWITTIPVILCFYFSTDKKQTLLKFYENVWNVINPFIMGLIIRSLVAIPLNYYFAIPIWTGMDSKTALSVIPVYIIFIFNTIQSILEVALAWIIVYRFRLMRFTTFTE